MATNKQEQQQQNTTTTTKPRKVIFSFAAYAKDVITTLKSSSSNVHVTTGLTTTEISAVETAAGFSFPPDLRSILSEGLPVGPGFPNWRSSSQHQLRLLTSLPILSLAKEVSRSNFWTYAWGPRPENDDDAVALARQFLAKVPRLVPVYRHCYVPCEPSLAGNPVIYVHGGEVRLLSSDVGEFFKTTEFWRKDWVLRGSRTSSTVGVRKVPFWSDVAEESSGARRRTGWWKSGELGECLEDVVWKLREGGWGEEDVREMMMMDGGDERRKVRHVRDKESVERHVRSLSMELLRSGWSVDDVVYSLGGDGDEVKEGDHWVDFQCLSANQNSLVLSR